LRSIARSRVLARSSEGAVKHQWISGVLALAVPSIVGAQVTDTSRAAGDRPVDTAQARGGEPSRQRVTIRGYAEVSYSYSTSADSDVIVGRLYDRFQDQFALNAVEIAVDRPYATDKLDAGFHIDALFGQNASVLHSAGLDLGDQGDITQLYITLNIPTPNGNGVQLEIGKIATLLGLEVTDDVANPNWSEGNQFIFVENIAALGLGVEYKVNRHVDAQLRLINGWDVVRDNNGGKSLMGRVGLSPDDKSTIGIVGFYGPEQIDSNAKRYGVELLISRKLAGSVHVSVQGDYGKEEASTKLPDPTRDATWWALGGWISFDAAPDVGVALRGDFLADRNGARTSGVAGLLTNTGQTLSSATATLNVRAWQNILVRPEVRFDHSSLRAFGGRRDQVTFALGLAYLY
jgi:hypothetical protein